MTGRGSFAHHSCEYYEVRWSAVNWFLAVARMNGEDASLDYNSGIEHQSSDGTCYDLIWFCWKTVWELSGLQLTHDWEMSVIGQHHGRSCNSSTGNLWGCEVGKLTWQGCNVLSERIFRFDLLTPINKKSRTLDVIGIEEVLLLVAFHLSLIWFLHELLLFNSGYSTNADITFNENPSSTFLIWPQNGS